MRRTAGRVGWGGGPGEPASLFPPRPEPQVLEERERDHGHQRVPVQTGPGAALEMVEAELLLHLLVRLLARPARLDPAGRSPSTAGPSSPPIPSSAASSTWPAPSATRTAPGRKVASRT